MIFVADDGKKFESMAECEAYEKALTEKEMQKKKAEKEKAEAWSKVVSAYKEYDRLYKEYVKKYPPRIITSDEIKGR